MSELDEKLRLDTVDNACFGFLGSWLFTMEIILSKLETSDVRLGPPRLAPQNPSIAALYRRRPMRGNSPSVHSMAREERAVSASMCQVRYFFFPLLGPGLLLRTEADPDDGTEESQVGGQFRCRDDEQGPCVLDD